MHEEESFDMSEDGRVAMFEFVINDDFLASVLRGVQIALERSGFTRFVKVEFNFGFLMAQPRDGAYTTRPFTPGAHTNHIIHAFSMNPAHIADFLRRFCLRYNAKTLAGNIVGDKVGSSYVFVGYYVGICTLTQE